MTYRTSPKSTGINSAIVGILKEYNKEIPLDYLAKEICRNPSEIQESLKILEEKKIVKIRDQFISIYETL